MDAIALPQELFEDLKFQCLSSGNRMFLIDLYVKLNDVERFTIDLACPVDYGQPYESTLCRRIVALRNAGLIKVVGRRRKSTGHTMRIYSFAYAAPDLEFPRLASDRADNSVKAGMNSDCSLMENEHV